MPGLRPGEGTIAKLEYAYIFAIGCSLTVLLIIFVNTCMHFRMAGARSFLVLLAFIAVWSFGSLMELMEKNLSTMLFWSDFQQIGAFGTAVLYICFAAEYGGYHKLRKLLPLLAAVPAAALALIFTNESHHLMSYGHYISASPVFGRAVIVSWTPLGMIISTYCYCLALAALILLYKFAAKASGTLKRQVFYIILSMAVALAFGFVKIAVLERIGVNMPNAVAFLPANLLLFYSFFRQSLFLVSPIARDKAFDVIEQGIVVADGSGKIVDRNPFAMHLFKTYFGIDDEITGKGMASIFSTFPLWVEMARSNTAGQFEVQSSLEGSGDCYFRFKVYPLQAEKAGTVTIIRDITARRLQEFELKNKADMDGLTGLLNKTGFMEVFMRQLRESEAAGEPISTLILDLDRFKSVNDTYGHVNGDRVLVLFAELLKGALRQQDAIGRIGGDEFAASLPGVDRAEALHIAERIRQKAAGQGVEMEDGEFLHFTVSIGICDNVDILSKGGKPQAVELIKLADKAMYKAKKVSRNCCVVGE